MVQASDGSQPVATKSVKRWVLAIAIFGQFMGPFDGSIVNLAIPSIGKNLGGNISSLSWIITGYLIIFATFNLSAGRLADIRGRKNTFALGIAVFIIASVLCGFAPSVNDLIATRVVQALGASMMSGNAVALLSTFYAPSERGRALGISTASTYTGLSLGPSAGGFLIQYLGWRSIFFVNVPVGIVVLLIALFMISGELPKGKLETFDVRGSVIYAVAISMSLLGIGYLSNSLEVGLPILFLGIVSLVAFVLVESRTEHPLLDLRLFAKNRMFTLTNITTFLNFVSTFGISFIMSLYLRVGLGYSPSLAGLVLLAQPLVTVIFSPVGGYLSDRVEPRYQVSAAVAVMSLSIASLSTLGLHSTPMEIIVRLAFLGLGSGFFNAPNTNAVMSTVTRFQYGVASGVQNTMRSTGQAISLVLVTYILSTSLHENVSSNSALQYVAPDLLVAGVRTALIVLAIINALGIFTSLKRGKNVKIDETI